jgi:ATP-binding cassette ChvD family protein
MSSQYIYTMNRVSKVVPPKRQIIKDISLSFFPGAKIGLLGLNGAGKSTVLRIMAGVDQDFQGEARPQPGIKIGYLEQEPRLNPEHTVREAVEEGVGELLHAQELLDAVYAAYAEEGADFDKLAAEQQRLEAILATGDADTLELQLEIAADALRLPPWDAICGKLSGGEKRRVALCRLLLSKPDMLLLDEPTNHLDAESVAWLQHHLEAFPGCVILVTHDRYFLDQVTKWTLELDRGKGIPYEGNYSSWLEQKAKRVAQEERENVGRQRAIERELDWVRSSPSARRSKSKARLAAYDKMMDEQQNAKAAQSTAQIQIPPGPRLGSVVIEAENLEKAYGEKLLFKDLEFKLPPGGIVGVIGPNGAGKTTLFKLITGQETPDAGAVRLGDTVKMGYVDQSRDALDAKKNVWEEISNGDDVISIGGRDVNSRAYVSGFNFKGADQQKKIGMLSGGERNRVHLAKVLRSGANVLLLDEPTNDLDVETLQALEAALEDFAGCAVVISHDRWFLDRLATHILAFEGDSQVDWFEGNFEAYEEDKKRRLGADSLIPHRIKFQKFTR